MRQCEAVIVFTKQVLGPDFREGEAVLSYITKEQKNAIAELIVQGFLNGTVQLSDKSTAKFNSTTKLRIYARSLVTNHFLKAKALNGGVKPASTNPRTKVRAEVLKLRALFEESGDLDKVAEIDSFIANQKPQKPKTSIDVNKLPEELRELLEVG